MNKQINTLQPHLLLNRLLSDFELNPSLAMWILEFIIERPQRVCVNGCLYDSVCISTGSPQGCGLSPLLFVLCTNNCKSDHENRFLIQFSDDTDVVSDGSTPVNPTLSQIQQQQQLML